MELYLWSVFVPNSPRVWGTISFAAFFGKRTSITCLFYQPRGIGAQLSHQMTSFCQSSSSWYYNLDSKMKLISVSAKLSHIGQVLATMRRRVSASPKLPWSKCGPCSSLTPARCELKPKVLAGFLWRDLDLRHLKTQKCLGGFGETQTHKTAGRMVVLFYSQPSLLHTFSHETGGPGKMPNTQQAHRGWVEEHRLDASLTKSWYSYSREKWWPSLRSGV